MISRDCQIVALPPPPPKKVKTKLHVQNVVAFLLLLPEVLTAAALLILPVEN
jgi:hypothetical protein